MARQFCARDDPRLVMGRSAHGLCGVKFGILERGKANKTRNQRGWQRVTRDVNLVGLHDSDRTWQWPVYCWRWLSARRRGNPTLPFVRAGGCVAAASRRTILPTD